MKIEPYRGDCGALLSLWETSVRATHHFLSEADIQAIRPLVVAAFACVRLFGVRDAQGTAVAFMGLSDDKIEMLFVHPDRLGQGLGRRFVEYAVSGFGIRLVDVNEQNTDGLDFYLHLGFRVVSRDAVDEAGMPFPILHLELK